ncbi:helix-turn-helix domain-containing protein [Vreelandella andesensis]|uniref:Helix-turn-helix domain-containing protein n=1 Tax=Vreelandella andesensis TaxID=447567 RepID=A0A3S0VXG7_9GAMM|nr:helix-turn-helix domain-containing protein [Halomonas andesensis]RUR25701.1 helix-turn-helix domain-containing protein [Halomonas andesensis]
MSNDIQAHVKIAVAMRAVRGALGLNQAEFAELIGVSKPTVARVETLETAMRLNDYSNMLQKLKNLGVKVDTLYSDNVTVEFEPKALEALTAKLSDQGKRRSDRVQGGLGVNRKSISPDTLKRIKELQQKKPPSKK